MTKSSLNTGYWPRSVSVLVKRNVSVRKTAIEFLFRLEGEKKYSSPSSGLPCVVFCLWCVVAESVLVRSVFVRHC